jgi:hypothetical protein
LGNSTRSVEYENTLGYEHITLLQLDQLSFPPPHSFCKNSTVGRNLVFTPCINTDGYDNSIDEYSSWDNPNSVLKYAVVDMTFDNPYVSNIGLDNTILLSPA